MLDRKTKDIDANIELLNDRKERSKLIMLFFVFIWAILLVVGVYALVQFGDIKTLDINTNLLIYVGVIIILCVILACTLSIVMYISAINQDSEVRYYSLLIYLKKHFEKKKGN